MNWTTRQTFLHGNQELCLDKERKKYKEKFATTDLLILTSRLEFFFGQTPMFTENIVTESLKHFVLPLNIAWLTIG